jgi:hypothetical protein
MRGIFVLFVVKYQSSLQGAKERLSPSFAVDSLSRKL